MLIGGRELDPGEDVNLHRAGVLRLDPAAEDSLQRLKRTIAGAPLWIHIDLDVVDPGENFAVSHPAPGGISFARLELLIDQLSTSNEICGLQVCGYQPAKDPQRLLPARIAAAVTPALRTVV